MQPFNGPKTDRLCQGRNAALSVVTRHVFEILQLPHQNHQEMRTARISAPRPLRICCGLLRSETLCACPTAERASSRPTSHAVSLRTLFPRCFPRKQNRVASSSGHFPFLTDRISTNTLRPPSGTITPTLTFSLWNTALFENSSFLVRLRRPISRRELHAQQPMT